MNGFTPTPTNEEISTMPYSREQLELLERRGLAPDPIEGLAFDWLAMTQGEDLPLRFVEDCEVMLKSLPPERIRAAFMDAGNRASVTRERRWSYVLTSLNFYLISMDHPSMHTPAEQAVERDQDVAELQGKVTKLRRRWF